MSAGEMSIMTLSRASRGISARFHGQCAYSGIRFNAHDIIRRTECGSWVANKTMSRIRMGYMDKGASYRPHGPFDADAAWEALEEGHDVVLYTQVGKESTWYNHNGKIMRRGTYSVVSFKQFKSRTRAAIFMVRLSDPVIERWS